MYSFFLTSYFLGGSGVKNLPAMQQMWVWSLRREDHLEKERATHSRILDWEIPWKRTGRSPGEGKGNPL